MSERSVKALHYILLAIIALVFVLPLIWLVVASFDMGANQSLKWPDQWTFSNYANVLTNASIRRPFVNVYMALNSYTKSFSVRMIISSSSYLLANRTSKKCFNVFLFA